MQMGMLVIGFVFIVGGLIFVFRKDIEESEEKGIDKSQISTTKTNDFMGTIDDLQTFNDDSKAPQKFSPKGSPYKVLLAVLVILAVLFFIKKFVITQTPFSLDEKGSVAFGLTEEEYQKICVETLKPAMEESVNSMVGNGLLGGANKASMGDTIRTTLNDVAKEFDLPDGDSVKMLCVQAEKKFNPDGDDKLFP